MTASPQWAIDCAMMNLKWQRMDPLRPVINLSLARKIYAASALKLAISNCAWWMLPVGMTAKERTGINIQFRVQFVVMYTHAFKNRVHANNLCAYLYGSGGINNFVLVRNSANYRFDNNFRMMLERYSNMFGNVFWQHLMVVMTRVESGFAENQFNRGNVAQNMKNHIYESFELDAEQYDIPIIAMGMDNYTQALQSIVDNISDERFECEQIKSPLNELKEKKVTVVQKEGDIQAKVDDLNGQIKEIQDKIDALVV